MSELPCNLNRTVVIRASRQIVFRFFTDSARRASWWGAGSTIDANPGGKVYIRHPNGIEVTGEILEVRESERIVFTYGYASGKPIPPGGSRVTISLEPDKDGTRLHLLHQFPEAAPRDEHVQGWRFQLSLFGNVVANEAYAGAQDVVDGWFEAWTVADEHLRLEALTRIVTPEISFRDRYSLLDGVADLTAHIAASLRFMPGIAMRRKGAVRHCQGTVLADWVAVNGDGRELMSGTNVFVLAADGRISSVVGVANPPAV
jgi:uncharacterized protein YndB with AHSA1/START domain